MTHSSDPADAPQATGVRLRCFAGDADFPRMAAVVNSSARADGLKVLRDAEQIRRDYAAMPHFNPARDMIMAEVDDVLVAYARTWDWISDGALVQGQIAFVHADHRRRGIGRKLLQWLEGRQREIALAHAGATSQWHQSIATESEHARAHLLEKSGYHVERHLFEMERPTLDDVPDFALPAGFEVRPVQTGHLRAIHEAHGRALRDVWGYSPPRPGDFEAWMQSRTFQPHLWQVAWHVESNEVAGQVKPWIDAEQNEALGRRRGYTEFISVGAPWRRRGLARALVVRALRAQKEAGMLESALGVDGESAFNTTRLYEACGFRVARRNLLYRKAVDLNATAA